MSVLALSGILLGAAPAPAASKVQPIQPRRPLLTPAPEELDFGAVDIHGADARQTVRIVNEFPKQIEERISSVKILGKESSSFQIVGDECTGRTLAFEESCAIEVSFHPGATVARSATLDVFTEEEEEIEVPLSGEGITGQLSASPDPLSFSPIPYTRSGGGEEGGQNETEEVRISDFKAGTQVEEVSITGEDASAFSVQYGNCEDNLLAPKNSCDVGVRFQPTSSGVKHAQLVITSDSSSSPLIVPLEGEGLQGPEITLSSTQALLGDVSLGSSAVQTFTLTNTGDYPLGVQEAVLVSGTPLMFPILSDTCSRQVVKPGASCAVTLAFAPTSTGEKDASILFITTTSLPLHIAGIDGVGVEPAPTLPPAPTAQAAPPVSPVQVTVNLLFPQPPPAAPTSGGPQPSLTLEGLARIFGGRAVDTGVNALCPSQSGGCEVQSFITTSIAATPLGRSSAGTHRLTVLLGSTTTRLSSGANARVRIPLSRQAISLLRRSGRLRAKIGLVLRAGKQSVATRTRLVTLR